MKCKAMVQALSMKIILLLSVKNPGVNLMDLLWKFQNRLALCLSNSDFYS